MEHNPLKPDEKRPWCKKCRAHTSYAQGQHGVVGHQILKCDRCEGEMLKNAYGMTHSSRLGCIVPALRVLGVLLLIAGVLLFVRGNSLRRAEGVHIIASFFLACGAGCFPMAFWLSRLRVVAERRAAVRRDQAS